MKIKEQTITLEFSFETVEDTYIFGKSILDKLVANPDYINSETVLNQNPETKIVTLIGNFSSSAFLCHIAYDAKREHGIND